jgi:hypothetical protein
MRKVTISPLDILPAWLSCAAENSLRLIELDDLMKRLLLYLRKHLKGVLFGLGMALLNQVCLLLDPLTLQRLLDKFAFATHKGSWVNLAAAAAPGFAALIASVFCAWLSKGFQIAGVNRVSHLVGASMFSPASFTPNTFAQ